MAARPLALAVLVAAATAGPAAGLPDPVMADLVGKDRTRGPRLEAALARALDLIDARARRELARPSPDPAVLDRLAQDRETVVERRDLPDWAVTAENRDLVRDLVALQDEWVAALEAARTAYRQAGDVWSAGQVDREIDRYRRRVRVNRAALAEADRAAAGRAEPAGGGGAAAGWACGLGCLGLLYFAPAAVAGLRRHPNTPAVFATNLVLGWTGVGWVAALVWACWSPARPAAVHYHRWGE